MNPDRVMTTKELSNYIKLNEKTIIKMAQNKELPGVKVGNQWRFHIEAVDQYLQRDIVENTPREELNMIIKTTDQIVPLSRLVDKSLIKLDLEAKNAKEVFRKLADIAGKAGIVADKNKLVSELEKREKMLSTAVGRGIAIPHPRHPSAELFRKPNIVIVRLKNGIEFEAPDKKKVRLFFMTCAPNIFEHLRLLAKTAKVLQTETVVEKFMKASDNNEIMRILLELERNNIFPR